MTDRRRPRSSRAHRSSWWECGGGSRPAVPLEIAGVPTDPPDEALALARDLPDAMRSGVRDAIRTLFRAHADTPVLVLEDAHWADAATLRLVDDIGFDARFGWWCSLSRGRTFPSDSGICGRAATCSG